MKIIQIAATTETEDTTDVLYALGDDGSIWYLIDPVHAAIAGAEWAKLPDIPETERTDQ